MRPGVLFQEELQSCTTKWERLLRSGAKIEVPEPRVNEASRALLAGLFTLTQGDRLIYSAGNAYERQFERNGLAHCYPVHLSRHNVGIRIRGCRDKG